MHKDNTLQGSIWEEQLEPENVPEGYPKKLDEFIKDALSKQKKTRDMETDTTLEKSRKY